MIAIWVIVACTLISDDEIAAKVAASGDGHTGGRGENDADADADADGDSDSDVDADSDADNDSGNRDSGDTQPIASCGDAIDNDGDGWTDTEDPDCGDGSEEVGFGNGHCNDGIDNDGDVTIDADEPDCVDALDCSETPVRRCEGLLITEVMANAADETSGEYVELWNGTGSALELAGLSLFDADATDMLEAFSGATVVAAGEYALIVDPNYIGTYYVDLDVVLVTTGDSTIGNGLSTSDTIAITGTDGITTLASYSFPLDPGDSISVELLDPDLGDIAGNWVAAPCEGGVSPGRDNCAWE